MWRGNKFSANFVPAIEGSRVRHLNLLKLQYAFDSVLSDVCMDMFHDLFMNISNGA